MKDTFRDCIWVSQEVLRENLLLILICITVSVSVSSVYALKNITEDERFPIGHQPSIDYSQVKADKHCIDQ